MKRTIPCLLCVLMATTTIAGTGTQTVDEFLSDNEDWADPEFGARADLYQALANAPPKSRQTTAAGVLAEKWKISRSVAAKLIDGAITAEHLHMEGGEARDIERLSAMLRSAVTAAPDSPEVWAVALHAWSSLGRCGDRRLEDEHFSKPFAESRWLLTAECLDWLPHYVRMFPKNLDARFALASVMEDRDIAAQLALARWQIEDVASPGGTYEELKMALLRTYWTKLGEAGLADLLLEEGSRAGPALLDAALHREVESAPQFSDADLISLREARELRLNLRRQWMVALLHANRAEEARAEMARPGDPIDDVYLKDALGGAIDGDIWERYVGNGEDGGIGNGALWKVGADGATAMRVAARFLGAHRMTSAADMLRTGACDPYQERDGWPRFKRELEGFPAEFQTYWTQHVKALEAARIAAGCQAQAASEASPMSSRLVRHTEVPLARSEMARAPLPDYKRNIPLPDSFEVVRAQRAGSEIRALCISAAVDPSGEVGRGGYWLVRSTDAGESWSSPHYLGFQHQNPYVVLPKARISMFASGVLRLEVEVAELDPESIIFPPVALSLRREARDLYIDIPLEDIERDTDGDGFTDLLEAKLATDPANADTDGDGIGDYLDDFPQASARAPPSAFAPIIADVLKQLTGYETAGISEPVRRPAEGERNYFEGLERTRAGSMQFHFVEGDVRQFAGVRASGQVIVLDAAQVADIQARYGPFYPLSIPVLLMDPDGKRALVHWSAGWTGGTINYTLEEGRWVAKRGSEWITRAPRIISAPHISPG